MSKTVGLILGALGVLGVPSASRRPLAFLATLAFLMSAPLGSGLGGSFCFAQTYKCDWCVIGSGGGDMTGAYKCGSTVGQTAAGQMTGSNYWALIGYWQAGGQTGIREASQWPSGQVVETRLYVPQPNPARTHVAIRYSLATEGPVTLRVHDLTGRVVRTLCASSMKRGEYSITWNGTDDRGRGLARGVYFCRLVAGDYQATEKVVLER